MFRKFEDYIAKLIFEIPLPLNKTKLKLYLPPTQLFSKELIDDNQVVELHLPRLNGVLPYVNYKCIEKLFTSLSLDNILLLFRRVLLDTSNILVAPNKKHLIECCEAIKSLIFPYKYE